MKICRHCISKISEDVKRCPNCGKNPNKDKDIIMILVVILISITLIFVIGSTIYYLSGSDFEINLFSKDKGKVDKPNIIQSIIKNEKTIVCTNEENEEGLKSISKYTIIAKNDIVKKFTAEDTSIYDDSSGVDLMIGFANLFYEEINKIEGIEAKMEKVNDNTAKSTMKADYDKLDYKSLLEFFEAEEEGLYKKDITTKDFINNLEGYTCK